MSHDKGVDYQAVTARQKEVWATGDFHEIARQNVVMADALCAAVDPHAGERVLDIACGSGTAALVAARRYCDVTGIDYVPALIERARLRAAADGLDAHFQVADAQALPFTDASFDVILSVYGVQFAPDQQRAASELLRVCRPGGRIGLATPIPKGWSGDFFATNAKYMPPPPGLQPPLRWGTEAGLEALLGAGTSAIASEEHTALQYYRSVEHAVDVFLSYFGPAIRASTASTEDAREQFRHDLHTVFSRYNRALDGTAVIENRYFLTLATRA
ncbi:Ubiquinone/menaquinone biosynthesis C-methylase UbiE [Franzmannia pantelleriensis]|uniref:Ubiquinone/menaquinone biosynthesis C-methylase UbiE n=1 Tax=Franzmannia pantelleriensis TaxID=48727 RepID=A0A1G9US43_9GAMM|nr:class I SAM-dependent methyltransferase [Halomonas pantelleriensis]SDM62739.1 Ubiquinone/menaquinone biosynthesis C-methylase UbiE [Halomonas pantelleriensis]